jgi:hypothetical protein
MDLPTFHKGTDSPEQSPTASLSEWHVYCPLGKQAAAPAVTCVAGMYTTVHSLWQMECSIVAYGLHQPGSIPSPNRTRADRR